MPKEPKNQEQKLYPLRKFSLPGIYSVAYLSQLVQRGKLKAKKIGRNYFTTKEWFNEYLERHARDEKQQNYRNFLDSHDIKLAGLAAGEAYRDDKKVNYIFKQLSPRVLALSAAFFVVIIIGVWFFNFRSDQRGQVAGESEAYQAKNIAASSTNENF